MLHPCLIQIFVLFLLQLTACKNHEKTQYKKLRKKNEIEQVIQRKANESFFRAQKLKRKERKKYPWEQETPHNISQITKSFFRCKGNALNPSKILDPKSEPLKQLSDCAGFESHSLPLKDGEEFIYPILIDILNYIQKKSKKQLFITCGHRCPQHNSYADPSPFNQNSKHQIGAEVDFYVLGLEKEPHRILVWIFNYYQEMPFYSGKAAYQDFKRYTKGDLNVSTPPWYNHEIFIKLFLKNEGRDEDNKHAYPYLSIQVRYDKLEEKKVSYSWHSAHKNYLRM